MREQMEQMEDERAQMIAEVEAQIERALASTTLDGGSEDGGGDGASSSLKQDASSSRVSSL